MSSSTGGHVNTDVITDVYRISREDCWGNRFASCPKVKSFWLLIFSFAYKLTINYLLAGRQDWPACAFKTYCVLWSSTERMPESRDDLFSVYKQGAKKAVRFLHSYTFSPTFVYPHRLHSKETWQGSYHYLAHWTLILQQKKSETVVRSEARLVIFKRIITCKKNLKNYRIHWYLDD